VELLENFCHHLDCSWWINDLGRKQGSEIIIGFGDDEMDYQWALDQKGNVEALRTRLKEMGLQPGTASLIQCFSE